MPIPKSISASALMTAETCFARYDAEWLQRAPSPSPMRAADLGSSVHGALEYFVKYVYIDKTHEGTLALLEDLYKISYIQTFESADLATLEFKDGWEMLKKWFARTKFDGVEVISAETKTNFMVPTSAGEIPFNYIWDRCDRLERDGLKILRIVDYKSVRVPISAEQLRQKIQARCYDLAARIQFKGEQIDQVWVTFDLLRHEPVTVVFNRSETADTWAYIKSSAQAIVDTALKIDNGAPMADYERLNSECRFCVRKAGCVALQKNIIVGGIGALDVQEMVELKYRLESQTSGQKALIEELEGALLVTAEHEDLIEWNAGDYQVKLGMSSRRHVDMERAAKILPAELIAKYGKINVGDIDRLLKEPGLTIEMQENIQSLIYKKVGEPSVKISPVNPIGGES